MNLPRSYWRTLGPVSKKIVYIYNRISKKATIQILIHLIYKVNELIINFFAW